MRRIFVFLLTLGLSTNFSADLSALTLTPVSSSAGLAPALLVKATDAAGNSLILCDFASAGQAGTAYTTWLPVHR